MLSRKGVLLNAETIAASNSKYSHRSVQECVHLGEGDGANKRQNPTWPKRDRPVPWAAPLAVRVRSYFMVLPTIRHSLVPHAVYVIVVKRTEKYTYLLFRLFTLLNLTLQETTVTRSFHQVDCKNLPMLNALKPLSYIHYASSIGIEISVA